MGPQSSPISSASERCQRITKCVPTMKVMWIHERYNAPSTLLPQASTTLNPEKGSRLQPFRSLFRIDHATAPLHHDLYGRLCINSAFAQLPRRNVGKPALSTLRPCVNGLINASPPLLMFSRTEIELQHAYPPRPGPVGIRTLPKATTSFSRCKYAETFGGEHTDGGL